MPHRCDAKRHRRTMEGHNPLATVGRADEDERIAEEYSWNYRADASPSSTGYDRGWDSGTSSGARLAPASAVLANAVRTDVGPGIGCSLFVGQRTFETRSLYLILAEKLFILPAANKIFPLSVLFAGKFREVGVYRATRRCGLRLPIHLGHAAEDDGAVAVHALGVAMERGWQNRSQSRCLLPADAACRGSVVGAARRLGAVDAGAPFDQVEIKLENALLAEDHLSHRHQGELRTLAQERSAGSEEEILDELLREGRTSAAAAAFHVLLRGEVDLVPVEAVMLVEASILGCDDRVLEVGRDLAEGNKAIALPVGRAVDQRLDAALDVHRGRRRIDPTCGDEQQHGKRPEREEAEKK